MSQAILRTERVELVPLSDEHLEHEVELDADPEVMRYLAGRARTREEVEDLHRRRLAVADRVPGLGFWAGFVDGRFVGWWILEPPTRADQGQIEGQAELGYRLLRRYWRQGLASEGARELLRHGFEDLGLTRVFAETMAVNTASRATMTSIGMRYVRTFHQDWEEPLPGSDLGEVEYAITREQWAAKMTRILRTGGNSCISVDYCRASGRPKWNGSKR
ncbi:GNAT family N-acetyltransferase [Microbispora sp. H11081]|uniref:GNAT family N-acetyltransferase n=1 Tax=Microbispora sp. H11081 TaxID=2729107 RepID=UPI0014737BBF|nr:GNAT family N-acetyltransferase [Microbispora sp. H11081]